MTISIKRLAITLALLVGLTPLASLRAMQQEQKPEDPGAAKMAPAEKSFKGTIQKSGEKLVLKAAKASYELDDQEKAQSFEGKEVKVTGTLDAATHTIHVTNIEPAT
ncbi:MAG TPA: DUF5818 domain-containing protein [Terriglobia bacterium]|nr:DUF5818 domain-containing protein [Terriglobia bacterium]